MQKRQEKLTKQLKKCRVLGPVATKFNGGNTGSWRLERPAVNFEQCVKCKICAMYCPVDAIEIDKNAKECVKIDYYYCKGCGICAKECPKKCISIVPERSEE
jgi:2-oxoacid:acceptor oxidoreductase delta subunit (pyruvate/2-ketoisovalerate family)